MTCQLAKYDESPAAELRAEPRTHLFLVAMLAVGAASTPVRIRNLSRSGALIEGSDLPAVGSVASIRRASLFVEGVVAWRSGNQAGMAFNSSIFVSAWLPKTASSRQCTIDEVVFETKNGLEGGTDEPQADSAPADRDSFLDEMSSLRSDLLALGEGLLQDVILVATHPEIQLLDIAVQKIDRLLSKMANGEIAYLPKTV